MNGRRTATSIGVGLVLFAVYVANLAPDVTFWDAGEFIAAAHSLGIPHPPGTPLFVLLVNVWARLFPFLSYAVRTNLFSALSTAIAGAVTAAMLIEALEDRIGVGRAQWIAAAAALCAGGMATVRDNATETEVYAASLALSVLTLWAAQRAGRRNSTRWRILTAYLMVLSVPLHLSALVCGPTAVFLASAAADETLHWGAAVALGGIFLVAMGLGKMSLGIALGGLILLALAPGAEHVVRRTPDGGRAPPAVAESWRTARLSLGALAIAGVAASALVFLVIRARFDPAINQGNPDNWHTLAYVVARRQYAVPAMWPRQAPFWLQLGNVFEYADWQVALSLAPGVIPGVARVAFTVAFAALGVAGSFAHRQMDRRSWRAVGLLLLSGSLGIVVYMNFLASPSFGWGVLSASAVREARERDYFFALGFWAWGIWAGYGALAMVEGLRWPGTRRVRRAAGIAVAMLPIALNWQAITRREQPEADLPTVFGEATLESAPRGAVLLVAGDNDTYPLWYLQVVRGLRKDVTLVTTPLLNAAWYQDEIERRERLLSGVSRGRNRFLAARLIAAEALKQGRPLAVALMVPAIERNQLSGHWMATGLVYVATQPARPIADSVQASTLDLVSVDSASMRRWAVWIEHWRAGRDAHEAIDPSGKYFMDLLSCPRTWFEAKPKSSQSASLDSLCNRR